MSLSFYNRVWWSAINDPENYGTADSGSLEVTEAGGPISGLASLQDYFFIFQERVYTVCQKRIGDVPFEGLYKKEYGCNSQRSIVEINGSLFYLADNGDIRTTNGVSDVCVSDGIKEITRGIINGRGTADYYGGSPNTMPNALYDKYNNAYRLFYAGTSTSCDKCLTYYIDRGIWLQATGTNVNATAPILDTTNLGVLGNADASGITYNLISKYSDPDKTGTFDTGWIGSGNPENGVKVYSVTVWAHADAGTGGASCNTSITVKVFNDLETNSAYATEAQTLAYNSTADNLIRLTFSSLGCVGNYVRVQVVDSGSGANYSIDKIMVGFEPIALIN